MRRGLVALTAAIVLLPGCHQYWGTSSSPSSATVTYEPLDGAAQAQANVRSAIPAIEAYYADNATYAGMTVKNLRETYDSGTPDVEIVKATNTTYCIESTVSGETFSKHGPTADIVPGAC